MNKSELISAIAQGSGLTKKNSEKALNAMLEAIATALSQGDKVQLVGFGTFETKNRSARMGRNPATGEPAQIPAARIPQFKAGKDLIEAVAE